jgi:hypothetical protein
MDHIADPVLARHGNGQGDSRDVLRNEPDLLPELNLIRIALERSPLTIRN